MNKSIVLFTTIFLTGSASVYSQQEFFVSPSGADTNPGTKEEPFQTITRARDAVRLVNEQMTADIHVNLDDGRYPLENTIEFTEADSGMNGHHVIYRALENSVPVLDGAVPVTGWTKFEGDIYQAKLDLTTKLRTLVVNNERAYMANRKANAKGGWGSFDVKEGQADWAWIDGSTVDGVKFDPNKVPNLSNPEDIEVLRNTKFNSHILGVREVTEEGKDRVLKFQQPYAAIALNVKYGAYSPKGDQVIYNAFEFLDEPGEFYFNRKKQTLFYIPRVGEDMSKAEVYAPRTGSLITIQGSSKTDRVSNLTFTGLTFTNTEAVLPEVAGSTGKSTVQAATFVRAFDEPDWHVTAYRAYDTMPGAVNVSSAQSIQFSGNTFKHIGNEGICFINDVNDSEITGNLCSDIGGGAIQVGHPQHVYEGDTHEHAIYPPETEAVCRNILVENNVLYDTTTLFYGHAPITAYFVDGLNIVRNHIQKCNYTAVSLGWGWNNFDEISIPDNPTTTARNNSFNHNRVYDCMRMLHDGGAFYTLGSQPESEASGNYVKASTTHFQGVYHPDEGTAWYTGKDLVFEIRPDQDNFELNKWRNKHDNHYTNIYTTSEGLKLGAPNCTVENMHVIPDANWPEEALEIIRAAGPSTDHHDLLEVIPDISFKEDKRYDNSEVIVSKEMVTKASQPTESEGGRYEAEEAKLSNGAKTAKEHKGYSGKGYVEGFYDSATAEVTFGVESEELGTYDLNLRYAAGHNACKNLGLYINGEKSEVLDLKSTGDWNKWETHSVSVFLKEGLNTIALKPDSESTDCINLDFIQIAE
ncbi:MAG: CBM35 domain-containing protein [Luteolibacter sp.]